MVEPAAASCPSRLAPQADDARAFADRVAAVCARVLGGALASVILHGSLVLGDYAPGQSDVDLLAVVDRPLGRSEVDDLVRGVIAAHAGVACLLDLRVVTREVAAIPPEVPPVELCVALDPRAQPDVVFRHPGEPELVIELSVCRARGRALLGAEPSELIGEIPDRWVLRHGDAHWRAGRR